MARESAEVAAELVAPADGEFKTAFGRALGGLTVPAEGGAQQDGAGRLCDLVARLHGELCHTNEPVEESAAQRMGLALQLVLAAPIRYRVKLLADLCALFDQDAAKLSSGAFTATQYVVFVEEYLRRSKLVADSSDVTTKVGLLLLTDVSLLRLFWNDVAEAMRQSLVVATYAAAMQHDQDGVAALLRAGDIDGVGRMCVLYAPTVPHGAAVTLCGAIVEEWVSRLALEALALRQRKGDVGGDSSVASTSTSGVLPPCAMETLERLVLRLDEICDACGADAGGAIRKRVAASVAERLAQLAVDASLLVESVAAKMDQLLRPAGDLRKQNNEDDDEESSNASDKQLADTARVASFIHDLDAIRSALQMKLAKRLLSGEFQHLAKERRALRQVQLQLGAAATRAMWSMLHDVESSAELEQQFNEQQEPSSSSAGGGAWPVAVAVRVLNACQWPPYRLMRAPVQVHSAAAAFERFFKSKGANGPRRLTWVHSLGSAVVRLRFSRGTKDVVASVFQASMLVALNSMGGKASQAELADAMGFGARDDTSLLGRVVDSMKEHAGTNVLAVETVGEQPLVSFNMGFKSARRRFRLSNTRR
jgi:hypothetical protein